MEGTYKIFVDVSLLFVGLPVTTRLDLEMLEHVDVRMLPNIGILLFSLVLHFLFVLLKGLSALIDGNRRLVTRLILTQRLIKIGDLIAGDLSIVD